MPIRKIALIGHSGSGKTTSAKNLCTSSDKSIVDMDCCIPTNTPPGIEVMLDWVNNHKEEVLALSVHIAELEEMSKDKINDRYKGILFVYLHTEKEELCKRLLSRGETEDTANRIINNFVKDDNIYTALMDEIIKTTNKSNETVVAEIKQLLRRK